MSGSQLVCTQQVCIEYLMDNLQWRANSCWLDVVIVSLFFNRNNPFNNYFIGSGRQGIGPLIQRIIGGRRGRKIYLMDNIDNYSRLYGEIYPDGLLQREFRRGSTGNPMNFLYALMTDNPDNIHQFITKYVFNFVAQLFSP